MGSLSVGLLMAILSLFISSQYRSEASILPEKPEGAGGGLLAAAATLGIKPPSMDQDLGETYPDILTSHWLDERLVTRPFHFSYRVGLIGPTITRDQSLVEYFHVRNVDLAIRKLPSIFVVRRDLKTGVVTLAAESKSPELSRDIARTALNLLEEFLTVKKNTRGKEKAAFIRQRIKEAGEAYDASEECLRGFLLQNKNFKGSLDPNVQLKGARLEGDLALRRQVVVTLTLNLEQALQQEKDTVPVLAILDDGYLPLEKSRPSRAVLVLCSMVLAAVLLLAWERRRVLALRIRAMLSQ
jgi:hypothetical protein